MYSSEEAAAMLPLTTTDGLAVGDRVVWVWPNHHPLYDDGTQMQRGDTGTITGFEYGGINFRCDDGRCVYHRRVDAFARDPHQDFVALLTRTLTP